MTRFRWLIGVLAAGTAAMVLTGPAAVAVAAPTLAWSPEAGSKMEAEQPEMFAALQRDLRLDRDEVIARVGRSDTARRAHDKLRSTLGRAYGGAWLDPDGAVFTVAVTDPRLTGVVRAAGARPQVVAHSLAYLRAAVDRMSTTGLPEGIQTWYVDQAANNIVVESSQAGRKAAAAMVARAGVASDLVRFVTVARTASPTAFNIVGGDRESRSTCTYGFGIRNKATGVTGTTTAGHCGPVNQAVEVSGFPIGKVQASTFFNTGPSPDQGWASIDSFLFEASPEINTFTNGMTRSVSGSVTSMVGDFVCMAGRISKFRCGTVEVTGMPINLPFKVGNTIVRRDVTNVTRTNYCAGFGDSGAPVVAVGFAAAGIHIAADSPDGVNTGCNLLPNGKGYYQPIEPILNAFGLELLPPMPPRPTALHITGAECEREAVGPGWVCFARWAGGVDLATASWSAPVPRPAPYVITDSDARMTEAHLACFFDEAEFNYSVLLTVRDAVGTQVSRWLSVCGW
jgi:streptogrisin C